MPKTILMHAELEEADGPASDNNCKILFGRLLYAWRSDFSQGSLKDNEKDLWRRL